MNLIYKGYCRIFQLCFKIALPILPYKDPKIINNISDISNVIKENGKHKPLIVTDKTISKLGLLDDLKASLLENNIEYALYDDVVANPTTVNCNEALALYNKEGCDSLIAFGGGSAMDAAKGVGALKARPGKNLNQLGGILHVRKKIPTLIAVPTTAGTGSETTLAAVIVDAKTRHKYAINDFPLIPSYACLDESVCMSLPKSVVGQTGMDALTHAIEAYIGRSGNKKTRKDALEAIRLIFDNLIISYNDKTRESRKNMLIASHLAGRAFSKAYVGNVHALAHALGGKYNTPHGLANAVILPIVLREYKSAIYKKMKKIAIYIGLADKKTKPADACNMLIEKIEAYNKLLGIPKSIDSIKLEDIDAMASYSVKEANPLYPVPVIWNKNKFMEIFKKIGALNE